MSNEHELSNESEEDFFNEEKTLEQEYSNIRSSTTQIERKHNSEGYLSGITASKEEYLQKGFDYGYKHGAQMGILVGNILGVVQTGSFLNHQKESHKNDLLEIKNDIKKSKALTPAELFSNNYYQKDHLKLPGFLVEDKTQYEEINDYASIQPNDKNEIESFLLSPFPGNPELHPSVKLYAQLLKSDFKIDITT